MSAGQQANRSSLAGRADRLAKKPSRWQGWLERFDRWLIAGVRRRAERGQLAKALDTEIEVISPENTAFAYQVAGPFPRFIAFLVDLLVCVLLFAVLVVFLGLIVGVLQMLGLGLIVDRLSLVTDAILSVVIFLTWWFYSAILETYWNGQTVAKRFMKLRVLSIDGNPINGLQATLRAIIRAAETLPYVTIQIFDPWITPLFEGIPGSSGGTPPIPLLPTMLAGLFAMALTNRFQRIGDLVCGTMVVREPRQWSHGLAQLEDGRIPHLAEFIPAGFVFSQGMTRALAAYVDRRRYFSAPRRKEIAAHLAEPLLGKFGLPPDTSYDLFLCALYYRAFVADQGREDTFEIRLNQQTRQFEGYVPEHKLQEIMRAGTSSDRVAEEERLRLRGMGARSGPIAYSPASARPQQPAAHAAPPAPDSPVSESPRDQGSTSP